jgi:magnesium chelatase family protein
VAEEDFMSTQALIQSLTRTATVSGTGAELVTIECTTTSGFAGLQMVGNVSDLCRDGKERAKTVLESLGCKMGHKRILINFSPADSRKEGNHFDLPIAISLAGLVAGKPLVHDPNDWLFAAELGLDGRLRSSRAAVPLALCAMEHGLKGAIFAAENAAEIRALMQVSRFHDRKFQYFCFQRLGDVLAFVFDGEKPAKVEDIDEKVVSTQMANFDDMYLDEDLHRIAVCFAVGGHSLLLRGTPGSGKSMFAARLRSLLPRLEPHVHLEALKIHSLTGESMASSILQGVPPFRQPHHTTNPHAVLGTGTQPGELSLAHGGILFLDELPEFRRDLLESLREPLETGTVHVARAQSKALWQSKVQLVAACNNCPCGFHGSRKKVCLCSMQKILAYGNRMSGPLLERIDIHFKMPELRSSRIADLRSDQSKQMFELVVRGRKYMHQRWGQTRMNCDASIEQILESSNIDIGKKATLLERLEESQVSARSLLRVLRVARTLADMDQNPDMDWRYIAEAIRWRPQP